MIVASTDAAHGDHRQLIALTEGWQLARTPPGSIADPSPLNGAPLEWHAAIVPGTVAETLHHEINTIGDYDADDWWYRTVFTVPHSAIQCRHRLCFDGLATLARVWLNGQLILASRNMFIAHSVDVTDMLSDKNELVIQFESLGTALSVRRARPRWKTALVDQQNLRWFRTTLLGRIPGWTPPVTPVGPWRAITLECSQQFEISAIDLQTRAAGTWGRLALRADVRIFPGNSLQAARIRVGDGVHNLSVGGELQGRSAPVDAHALGEAVIPDVPLWWPHTHGEPRLLACTLELQVNGRWLKVDLGSVGFKQITVDQSRGVEFLINDVFVFCRGACWTIADFLSLRGDPQRLRATLTMARDAGLNMLRIGGTMVYESTEFYRLCDELGILVWQDFMFANMDYPVDDPAFLADIEAEARQQLARLQRHVCVAAYCGGSEVAQQAAMLGRPAAEWTNRFFAETLPRHCATLHESIPYFPSTPWGGALPFHVSQGISHYYGVGAYRRPLNDVKHAGVKFTTECLGFSNVPDRETIDLMLGGNTPPPHHPRWKARVPRDTGAGWDFEDVRDYYLKALFNIDPIELRSVDLERYYALSRVVTGEIMHRVFTEWRKPHNPCGGGLVWFFQDLWPGAGWGVLDSTGRPKAAFWYLQRAWAKRTVRLTDEGLDGLDIVVLNESADPMQAQIELCLYQNGRSPTATAQAPLDVPARGAQTLSMDALLGHFTDATRAYRFGPPQHDVIHVRLLERGTGVWLGEDFYFPGGLNFPVRPDAQLTTHAEWTGDGQVRVTLRSEVFLQSVCVSCKDFTPSDNYFHMAPEQEKRLVFLPLQSGMSRFKADFEALNVCETVTVRVNAP